MAQSHHRLLSMKRKIETWHDKWKTTPVSDDGMTLKGSIESYIPLEVDDPSIVRRAEQTVRNYLKNVQVIRKIADAYGVRTYFFWQPAIQKSRKQLSVCERDITQYPEPWNRNKDHNRKISRCVCAVWDVADQFLEQHGIISLTSLFDAKSDDLFLDWNHLTPRANELIASACVNTVEMHCQLSGVRRSARQVAQKNSASVM
ncbi:MAG: hypothetical protein QNJ97_18085 [Myxococcota bacterium]|nr:hypothetical protein [Myxococcota bacterium]